MHIPNFPEFNSIINPDDKGIYIPIHDRVPLQKKLKGLTFQEIANMARNDDQLVIGMLVPKGHLVIDIDDIEHARIVYKAIVQRQEKVMVVLTQRGIHIHVKADFNHKTTKNLLACGALADTIPYVRGATYITMPFKLPNNKAPRLEKRKVIYYNGIEEMPFWLTPTLKRGLTKEPPIHLPVRDNRNAILNQHLWRLKRTASLTGVQREETIQLMNQFMTTTPLTVDELEATVLRAENNKELVQKEFFNDKDVFQHHKLGDYMIKCNNIRRDRKSRSLYYYDEQENIYKHDNDFLLGMMTRLVPTLKDFQKQETLKYIEQYLFQDRVDFNKSPFHIVFNNGLLDVETMTLKAMGPQFLETIKLNCDYNPNAYSDTAVEFFQTATGGCELTKTLLYETIGYAMIKTNDLQKAFILTGEGRNGKSTFLDLIKKILGVENTTTVSMKDLAKDFRISALDGKLASMAGDISNQAIPDTDLFKSLVGGEAILMEQKYKQAYTSESFATMFFACNQLPRTPDTTKGFYRRFTIIPFDANLDKVSRVEGAFFKRRLEAKESLEMVAYMAVQAIHNVLTNTQEFTEPPSVSEMLDAYRVQNSSVMSWVQQAYGTHDKLLGEKVLNTFGKYKIWAEDNNYKPVSLQRFQSEMRREFELVEQHATKKFIVYSERYSRQPA